MRAFSGKKTLLRSLEKVVGSTVSIYKTMLVMREISEYERWRAFPVNSR